MKLPKIGDKVIPVILAEDTPYLTAGREYTVTSAEWEFFNIIDDEGDDIACAYPQCLHAEKWELVE